MDLKLIEKYKALGIADVIDHEKFNNISVVHHSTVIEGSTLTEVEAQVLINAGLTPKGKPLNHSLREWSIILFLVQLMQQKENFEKVT
jgi:hypothetical protein